MKLHILFVVCVVVLVGGAPPQIASVTIDSRNINGVVELSLTSSSSSANKGPQPSSETLDSRLYKRLVEERVHSLQRELNIILREENDVVDKQQGINPSIQEMVDKLDDTSNHNLKHERILYEGNDVDNIFDSIASFVEDKALDDEKDENYDSDEYDDESDDSDDEDNEDDDDDAGDLKYYKID